MITPHVMWFDNTINLIKNNVNTKIKYKIKHETDNFNKQVLDDLIGILIIEKIWYN